MQIFVRNLEGRTLALTMGASASVEDVKQLIEAREGVPAAAQTLVCSGKMLTDSDELFEEASIQLIASLDGGAKKRKKKVFKTPKKVKHQKKKVKIAVLKYFKVDGNGKVTALRRSCPNCGEGVFMAKHTKNDPRSYCGRCGLTTKD